jgi:hypothetical protein
MTATADPSRRFVLAEDAAYLSNLAALWAMEPKLARAIESAGDDQAVSYQLETARSGAATISAQTGQGRKLYLHSRYEPREEAIKLVEPIKAGEIVACYVQGFGLGYHVEEIFERTGDDTLICVFEPNLKLLQTAFEQRDFSKLIQNGRVLWFWQADKGEFFTRLSAWMPSITMGFVGIAHAPSLELDPQFHQKMQSCVEELKAYAKTSITTLVINGKRTAENVSRNIPWYIAAPSLSRLKDRYKNQPAIIVSAGPSLRKNKHLLKDVAGNAVIIAVQTTLRPLLELGIEPHFVTSLDYHDISTRFWENLPPTLSTELIAEPKASEAILQRNPGPLSLLGNDFAENLLSELKLNKTRLPSGATVAHLAYYVAEHIGCDPIIFIGQDLGFSDGLAYTPGTSYEDVWRPELSRFCTIEMKQWEQIVRDRHILRQVPDQQGRPMYTEERLFTYLQHFEKDFARTRTKIIDATEGGVLKRGAASMTLADAIAQFCAQPLTTGRISHPGMRWDLVIDSKNCLENRRREGEQIEKISRQTLPLLEEIRDHISDQAKVNRAIGKIDVLRSRMAELGNCYTLIMQLTQKSELERFKADRRIAAAKVSGAERQKRQIERDIENVRSVVDAAVEFQNLMSETIAHVESFGAKHQEAA